MEMVFHGWGGLRKSFSRHLVLNVKNNSQICGRRAIRPDLKKVSAVRCFFCFTGLFFASLFDSLRPDDVSKPSGSLFATPLHTL